MEHWFRMMNGRLFRLKVFTERKPAQAPDRYTIIKVLENNNGKEWIKGEYKFITGREDEDEAIFLYVSMVVDMFNITDKFVYFWTGRTPIKDYFEGNILIVVAPFPEGWSIDSLITDVKRALDDEEYVMFKAYPSGKTMHLYRLYLKAVVLGEMIAFLKVRKMIDDIEHEFADYKTAWEMLRDEVMRCLGEKS